MPFSSRKCRFPWPSVVAAIIFPHTKWLPKITDYRDTAALISASASADEFFCSDVSTRITLQVFFKELLDGIYNQGALTLPCQAGMCCNRSTGSSGRLRYSLRRGWSGVTGGGCFTCSSGLCLADSLTGRGVVTVTSWAWHLHWLVWLHVELCTLWRCDGLAPAARQYCRRVWFGLNDGWRGFFQQWRDVLLDSSSSSRRLLWWRQIVDGFFSRLTFALWTIGLHWKKTKNGNTEETHYDAILPYCNRINFRVRFNFAYLDFLA